MVDAKTSIKPYTSILSSGQQCKDFMEDLRDHIDHYDPDMAGGLKRILQEPE